MITNIEKGLQKKMNETTGVKKKYGMKVSITKANVMKTRSSRNVRIAVVEAVPYRVEELHLVGLLLVNRYSEASHALLGMAKA